MAEQRTCGSCEHYVPYVSSKDEDLGRGRCTRNPPTVIRLLDMAHDPGWANPPMHSSEHCGEWTAREGGARVDADGQPHQAGERSGPTLRQTALEQCELVRTAGDGVQMRWEAPSKGGGARWCVFVEVDQSGHLRCSGESRVK